jgi:hypothetical protein
VSQTKLEWAPQGYLRILGTLPSQLLLGKAEGEAEGQECLGRTAACCFRNGWTGDRESSLVQCPAWLTWDL